MTGSAEVGVRTALASGRARSRRGLDDAGAWLRREGSLARHHWRQSLQMRVVTTTMLLGLAVVSLLGGVLHQQIASSLERDRVAASEREALALTGQAQTYWDASTSTSVDELNQAANDIMSRVLAAPGGRYVVMNRSADNDSEIVLANLQSGAVDLSVVSPELQAAVAANPGRQQTQMSEVTVDGRDVPAVIVGSVVEIPNAGSYDLYFVYPMEQEVATMDLIGDAFVVAGIILTILVGAVAWVVTRQVVTPVRRASGVAQRLSAGKLNERMPVRGEDDLALLATSFNGMADSLQSQIRQLEGLSAVQQRFVSDVSHELRTPLTTIRMAVDLIHESRVGFDPSVARSAELPGRRARPVRGAAVRPARDQPLRRRRGRARRRADRPARDDQPGRRGGAAARRAAGERGVGARARRAGGGRRRRAARRAHPAQPRRQRHRAR